MGNSINARVGELGPDALDWYEERAAILEYDTMVEVKPRTNPRTWRRCWSRAEAEELALAINQKGKSRYYHCFRLII